ncbi:MAG: Glu/Leu/Phe/Val dehydrogenase dimerization domain-containing protein [Gemmatimonadales bacterium]
MKSLISSWNGQSVVVSFDQPTETWMFIAIHDTTLGPAMGGCRMMAYDRPEDGLRDAMRLAEGMTYKWATIGFDLGGGKSVLATSRPLEGAEREGLFERFGSLIDSLRGTYACGADLGTTPHDMEVIGRSTKYVHGVNREQGSLIDPGPYTALGVLSGMKAALRQVFGNDDFAGRSIFIQGAGDVGYPLGEMVAEAGGTVIVTDMDAAKAQELADATGGSVVPPLDCYTTPCDVYAPCAVGATLNAKTIPLLTCSIVAGSANNQLAEEEDAGRLHERGILYAPDYVINAGGATALPLLDAGKATPDEVRDRIRGFDTILFEIFQESEANSVPPLVGAKRAADRVLEQAGRQTGANTRS